jgi:protein-tyrosine phosphatase
VIDLHCHLLHGIDDGPSTLEQSLELCRIAVADGITHSIVTPHIHPGRWENTRLSVHKSCMVLQQTLNKHAIPLQLGFAAEVRLTESIPDQITHNEIPFLGEVAGYKILLLEFPHGHIIPGSQKLAGWLLDRGIRPLIAHPERNKQVMRDITQLHPYLDLGCWLQVTAGSVTGQFGKKSQSVAHQLLERDSVKVLASDGHNARARPPVLSEAFNDIVKKYGKERAQRLVLDTPAVIVADQFT